MHDWQIIILTVIVGITVALTSYVSRLFKSSTGSKVEDESKEGDNETVVAQPSASATAAPANKRSNRHHHKTDKPAAYSHEWLFTSLKGHSGRVLSMDLSSNGKYLASCSDDRAILIWATKEFSRKDSKCSRGNVTFDHGLHLRWSPDCKALVVHKAAANCVEVYKLSKRDDGLYSIQGAMELPRVHGTDDVVGMDMDVGGKYIMTCSAKNELVLTDLRGDMLGKVDTFQMSTCCARASPCGRFLAAAGFTPEVKVWQVRFVKGTRDFEKVQRAFELTGHDASVYHFAWRADSAQMATVSKDGKWRVYRVDVEFDRGQDPVLIKTGVVDLGEETETRVALSPDGRILALSRGKDILVYSAETGQLLNTLTSVHTLPVSGLMFDAEGNWILSCGDKHVRVFHNVPGHKRCLEDLRQKLSQAQTEGLKERLKQQIDEVQAKLQLVGAH